MANERKQIRWIAWAVAVWLSASIALVPARSIATDTRARTTRPDIVLIVTDDQRWDTLRVMPVVRRRLAGPGTVFRNAFVVNPVCCPSRATLLTGAYSHTTGVYTNKATEPFGGFPAFRDRATIATALQDAGYATAFLGKYLNGYRSPYVPPGWGTWFAKYGGGGYYGYRAIDDGRTLRFSSDAADYSTTVLTDRAVDFIRTVPDGRPLFALVMPTAPHEPATPAPQDRRALRRLSLKQPRSFDERAIADKPSYVRSKPRLSAGEVSDIAEFRRDQLRSLLAVDRMVDRVVDALRATGRLGNTMIVFTSDNGMLWGEHRLRGKNAPYEESIRVPMVVRYDPVTDGDVSERMVLNLDIAPTTAALAGVRLSGSEGRSFLPLLRAPAARWRGAFLIEHVGRGVPTYCAVRTNRHLFVAYRTGERELYLLERDRAQLRNSFRERARTPLVSRLKKRLRELCSPRPPTFAANSIASEHEVQGKKEEEES